ncbi:MAG: DUF4114 domain-containing protein [Polyangiales bacterium]
MRLATAAAALLAALLAPDLARAIVTQPGGAQIPVGSQLQGIFDGRGERIAVRDDAAITPERFQPGCRLNITLVTRGSAAFQNVFGWYNVRPGMPPLGSDLHPLIPCTATSGATFELNLRDNPDYRGGEIGFFLRTPEDGSSGTCSSCCADLSRAGHTFYSERLYNEDSTGPSSSYIHLLIYNSTVNASAFYFAWEDLFAGGDNNFTDFIVQVDQLVCTGGGAPCNTGQMGACAQGTTQCRAGALSCVGSVASSDERCDGVDNDCDGMTDEGDGLCPAMQVCDRGSCVDRCLSELGCFPGLGCTDRGTCVESACLTVQCGADQRCSGGRCVGACEGITCPSPTVCRAGRCVEPCAGVTCDSDQVCVGGVCTPRCECRGCATGQVCGSDGACRAADCATVTCAAGMVCEAGACRDACVGAACPIGETCSMGRCVPAPRDDAGVARDVPLGDVGVRDTGVDVPTVDAGDVDAGLTDDVGKVTSIPARDEGCSCAVPGGARGGSRWLLALALASVAALRRRRR